MSELIAYIVIVGMCVFSFALGLCWRVFDGWEERVTARMFELTRRSTGDTDDDAWWCETRDEDCSVETCRFGCRVPSVLDTPGGRSYLANLERLRPTAETRAAIARVRQSEVEEHEHTHSLRRKASS